MSRRTEIPKLVPTPPSSAKPTNPRPGSVKRRLVRSGSKTSNSSASEIKHENSEHDRQGRDLDRKVSLSKYGVIPPINSNTGLENKSASDDVANRVGIASTSGRAANKGGAQEAIRKCSSEIACSKEALEQTAHKEDLNADLNKICPEYANNKGSLEQNAYQRDLSEAKGRGNDVYLDDKSQTLNKNQTTKTLYRKGDIFRRKSRDVIEASICRDETATERTRINDIFQSPPEPDSQTDGCLYLAFRLPDGNRLCRYFSMADRIGDVLVFLHNSLIDPVDKSRLRLSTNEVPTRTISESRQTLAESGIRDRMILNLVIYEKD